MIALCLKKTWVLKNEQSLGLREAIQTGIRKYSDRKETGPSPNMGNQKAPNLKPEMKTKQKTNKEKHTNSLAKVYWCLT